MVFLRNKPQAADLLSDSQPIIEDNFNTSDTVFGTDHYQFSDTTGNIGRHKKTTLVSLGNKPTNPTAVPGTYILYSNNYTPDTSGGSADQQLFGITGNGGVSQMTGNLATSDGWCWVGGILLQWGTQAFSGAGNPQQNKTLTFKDRVAGAIPFPNNCFNVQATLHPTGGGPTGNVQYLSVYTLSNVSFKWNYSGGSAYDYFLWFAIGN